MIPGNPAISNPELRSSFNFRRVRCGLRATRRLHSDHDQALAEQYSHAQNIRNQHRRQATSSCSLQWVAAPRPRQRQFQANLLATP